MTDSAWEFLPDDESVDDGHDDGPEAAALHEDAASVVMSTHDPESSEVQTTTAHRDLIGHWLDDEEPELDGWRGPDRNADGPSDADEVPDVETLLERQHYAFAPEPEPLDHQGRRSVQADTTPMRSPPSTNGSSPGAAAGASAMSVDRATELLAAQRQRLVSLRTRFERDGLHDAGAVDGLGELAHAHQHNADLATETYEHEVEVSIAHDIDEELDEIDRALSRLDDGRFGLCEACRTPIASARLEVLPATRWCRSHAASGR